MRGNFKTYIFLVLEKSRLYISKYITSCWRSLPGKSLHPLPLLFTLPLFPLPSLHSSPCLPPRKVGNEPADQARLVKGTPREKQFWVVWREGPPQANDWMVQGVGVSLPLCLLPSAEFCSQQHSFPVESRSGPPSSESLTETSFSIPLASWELTLTGRVGHLLGPRTK